MTASGTRANIKVLFALTLVHFTGDFYSSFISPLFPLFVDRMGLSLAQVGIIAGAARLLAFIVQPSVGYLADRYPTRWFVFAGLALPVVCIPASGLTVGFWSLLAAVAVGSLGSSMFHPAVTGMVPLYAGRNAGFAMSIFNTGGTFAFAVGPLLITWYATRFGLTALPATMIFGLAVLAYLIFVLPAPQSEGMRHLGFIGAVKESLGGQFRAITLIWMVMLLRAVVGQSFLTFMPVLVVQRGFSVMDGGVLFALFTVAGTISGLVAGHVSDRIGFKPVFWATHLLMTPALLLLLYLPGNWIYAGAAMAGGFVLASLPVGVVMAQHLAPKGRSMVASLMMGFAYGLGGAIAPVVGKLGDLFSIHATLAALSLLPLATLPLIAAFPRVGGRAK